MLRMAVIPPRPARVLLLLTRPTPASSSQGVEQNEEVGGRPTGSSLEVVGGRQPGLGAGRATAVGAVLQTVSHQWFMLLCFSCSLL